ncbi:MAG: ImmA/IrrE family metallo-endopeptidase [Pyrinomonadaceae bacterium]|nr:ImmA/IrrE family metallo-endopeptidase [Pyrinomonadaceae bacterium]
MSFILSQLIKKKLPEWNEKIFGIKDLQAICVRERLIFVESIGRRAKGEYLRFSNRNMIILRANLGEGERRWIAFHELGHHFLHTANHRFSRGTARKMDREANFFAAVALLPKYLIENENESYSDGYYPAEMLRIRFEILREFRI